MAQPAQSQNLSLSQHVVYSCSRFLAYGLPVLFFLVSVSFYLKTYDSAQIKITFTQIGTTILLMVWLIKILVEGRWPFRREDWVYVVPFLAYLASGVVAFIHTPFKPWSLEETLRRVFYVILALITIAEFRSEERMDRLWRWLLAAAWVAIGYGFLQYIDSRFFPSSGPGLDPFIWRQAFSHRIFSTYGNPNFFGNFLVIITPIILASVVQGRGDLGRPFLLFGVSVFLAIMVDKSTIALLGAIDPSYQVVVGALEVGLFGLFVFLCFWKTGGGYQPLYLLLFSLLAVNLYATETKGAWVGFIVATAVTVFLIFEYFLHFEERLVEPRKYVIFLAVLIVAFVVLDLGMIYAFIVPMLKKSVDQIGFQILWIPTLLALVISLVISLWLFRQPWNLKKMIYGALVFFVLAMGGFVLQFARTRLQSVSFRMFTWISTWEMIHSSPVFGNGVGTFKIIYPAYRRPQIIVLEGKSNTETDHAEDEYLEVWQDEGIIGFGIFLWLVFSTLFLAFKQLRWFSRLRTRDPSFKRKLLEIEADPHSYQFLGYTAAYIGALSHWFMDVSIRFVSSGIFSGLLPGAIVAYVRNQTQGISEEVHLSYDRSIRFAVATTWTLVLLWLGVELVPANISNGDTTSLQIWTWSILAGAAIWVGMELLEFRRTPNQAVPFAAQYPDIQKKWMPARLGGIVLVTGFGLASLTVYQGFFMADVHHNLAIFFSKESIWSKLPMYENRVASLPPDLRKKYDETGGALEHYKAVIDDNPAFPMAWYFRGNVYNDWGSQVNNDSMTARQKGDSAEAERLHQRSEELWDRSEEAYLGVKKLAPNYVQTHHQMGLLYMKRAEQASMWGDKQLAEHDYDEAYKNFSLYHMLDPVFPPNDDRMAQLLLRQGKYDEAAKLYEEGIYYNDVVEQLINQVTASERVADLALSLAKLRYNQALSQSPHPFQPPVPAVLDAIKYFRLVIQHNPQSVEALKGLVFLLDKTGQREGIPALWEKLRALAPNDPEVRASTVPH